MSVVQALVRNVGPCRPEAKGAIPVGRPPKGESTAAGHRAGVTRSRVEGPVLGLERRGDRVGLYPWVNP